MADIELAKRIEQLIKDVGITAIIYETTMQEITKYFYLGVDNVESMININFDTINPRVLSFLKEYNFNLIQEMNTDLANKLRDTISRNMLTGDKKNMTREIRDLFDSTINRAKTIARTETARAYAVGNYTGAIEAKKRGHNVKKYWLAVLDDRTSPLCRRLSAKYDKDNAIDIEKEFIDPKGEWRGVANPAHINCRSEAIYFIDN